MANEITWSSFATNAGLTEQLNTLVHENLVDLVGLEFLATDIGDFAGSGSSTSKVTTNTRNQAMAAAGSENASVSNSAAVQGSFTLAVARQTIAFEKSDFAHILRGNTLTMQDLVDLIVMAAFRRRSQMLASLFTGFSTVKGTTGVPLTLDDIYEADYALHQALAPAFLTAVLKPKQMTEIREDLRTEGGAVQFMPETAGMLAAKPQGFQGSFNGINFISADKVTDDATDFRGALLAPGAIYSGYASAQPQAGTIVLPANSSILVEVDREARTAESAFVGHDYFGVTEGEDARAVGLRSGV